MLICMHTQIAGEPSSDQVDHAVAILKLIADPTRLRILWTLLHGEHSVGHLAEHVGAQPAAVSQHLAKLRLAHLVRTRREGTHVYYLAQDDHVRRLVEEALFHAHHMVQGIAERSQDPGSHPWSGGAVPA
ncbi:MAG: metalloregulator ArsR/SmtB family transcription factor [Actinomycetota bacterium]